MGILYLVVSFVLLLMLRVPIAFALGLSSLGYIYWFMPAAVPLTVIPQIMSSKPASFPLLAIPFFVLVGELMNATGISERLVDLAKAIVGHFRGGMGIVSLAASALMSSFSGSSVANSVGVGGITIPAMKRQGYPAPIAAGIESAASSLGTVIPPSISMIVYGSLTGVSIGGLFIAGYIPGILEVIALAIIIALIAKRHGIPVAERQPLSVIGPAFVRALGVLAIPVIIIGGILLGVMTATEAGAVGAVYTLLLALVYRTVTWKLLYRVLLRTAVTTGVILTVIATASVLGYVMTYERLPAKAADALLSGLSADWQIMLVIVLLMVIIGSFMETNAAIAIIAPVIVGITAGTQLDPLFVGLIVVVSLSIGVATPPVGVCLFTTAKIARTTIEKVSVAVTPLVGAVVLITAILALLPGLVLWLPRLAGF
ncbi:C4-dicarboxylate transporter, DctM subunit [Paramicrobacterium humi]|uniref:C4-dicarboxylate transporter, DctM subunit n=1 Tax=Paramicrobacterium humi TaxID=640635 RepID=A0A1H4L6Q1_9MICO|nr:TRAP transporter large permease [Microbacterium humi]SEB66383.1 C4-dicarboxylate transporter, DctM subunit [Microbacterium humi]